MRSFPDEAFDYLYQREERHWWFASRLRIILWLLSRRTHSVTDFLEAGCGSGFVIQNIQKKFPSWRCLASENSPVGIQVASRRFAKQNIQQLDLLEMDECECYDGIGLFDVLEHIHEDELAIANTYRALRPGGFLIITVPQHPWLWSPADQYAEHVRRYTQINIQSKLMNAGFAVRYCTSFVFFLLPLMAWHRLSSRNQDYIPDDEFEINPLLNSALDLIMRLELIFLSFGLRFPVGGSLLIFVRKP